LNIGNTAPSLKDIGTVADTIATTVTLHVQTQYFNIPQYDRTASTKRKVPPTLDSIPWCCGCVRTSVTASSCVEGSTLLRDTVSSNRNTKLKVLLTKLDALHGVLSEFVYKCFTSYSDEFAIHMTSVSK
jgi:hypothetical protein